jgi:hypothetical protein
MVTVTRRRRWLMSALAVLIMYGNVAVIFNPDKLGFHGWPSLPRPFALHDAFLIAGMFSGYSAYNFDFFIEGLRTNAGRLQDRGQVIELPVREFFSRRYPLLYPQLFAAHHWDMLGDAAQHRALRALAAKIRARHNQLHPEAPIDRVQFGSVNFPQSPRGYRAAKNETNTWSQVWYSDP